MAVKVKQIRTQLVKGIERSEKIAGQIYPIIIDKKTGEIVDGRKRKRANPNWKEERVEFTSVEQKLAVKYHTAWFRDQLDKTKILTEVAEETGWRGLKPFADFFDVDLSTISKYLPQKYKIRLHNKGPNLEISNKKKQLEKAKQSLEGAKKKLRVIAKDNPQINTSLNTAIEKIEATIQETEEKTFSIEEEIENLLWEMDWTSSVWEGHYDRPEGYGDKDFHGNCSPVIIMALLKRYSESSQRILDPMAGSGTFGDVARAMGYFEDRIHMSDIRPIREDIEKFDAASLPYDDGYFDFIFAHFPYWMLIQYSEGDPLDASRFSYEEFIDWCEKVVVEMKRVLRRKGYFVAMIGNMRKGGIIDLEAKLSEIGTRHFLLWDKVVKKIRPWTPEKRGTRMQMAVARAVQQNRTMVNHDTILVFMKD